MCFLVRALTKVWDGTRKHFFLKCCIITVLNYFVKRFVPKMAFKNMDFPLYFQKGIRVGGTFFLPVCPSLGVTCQRLNSGTTLLFPPPNIVHIVQIVHIECIVHIVHIVHIMYLVHIVYIVNIVHILHIVHIVHLVHIVHIMNIVHTEHILHI